MKHAPLAASALVLMAAAPAIAQDEVQVLADWSYDALYASGLSVENMLDMTQIIDMTGDEIGDVENVIFSNDGEVLGIIAEVGGFWDTGDVHLHVPWDEVTVGDTILQAEVPVTEATVEDYDVFGDYWDEEIITEGDTDTITVIEGVAGANIFKATDLIGNYVFLDDGARYGYVTDILVEDGAISAVVVDAAAYGRRGYYAYPYSYSYRSPSPAVSPTYIMPYGPAEIDTMEQFDYDQLQSRVE